MLFKSFSRKWQMITVDILAWTAGLCLVFSTAQGHHNKPYAFDIKDFPNQFTNIKLMTDNNDALKVKRNIINSVKVNGTIDMAYFIIEDDFSSSLILEDLVKQAKERNVNIRI